VEFQLSVEGTHDWIAERARHAAYGASLALLPLLIALRRQFLNRTK